MTPLRPLAWTILLAVPALAGCMGPTPPAAAGIEAGDWVQIHYVARDAATGEILDSSHEDPYPEGTPVEATAPTAHDPAKTWRLVFDPAEAADRTGEDRLVEARLLDLTLDGAKESIKQVRADVVRVDGSLEQRDRRVTLWNVPPRAPDEPRRVPPGTFAWLLGRHAGDVVDDLVVPEDRIPTVAEDRIAIDRFVRDRPRLLENRTRTELARSGTFDDDTREGDEIEMDLDGIHVEARVVEIDGARVDVRLLLEEGQTLAMPQGWNATVVDVTEDRYTLRQDPDVDDEIRYQDRPGRVDAVSDERIVLDLGHPLAGHTVRFEIEVRTVIEPGTAGLFRGANTAPIADVQGNTIHDVAVASSIATVAATGEGAFVTFDLGEHWFPYSGALDGEDVRRLEFPRAPGGGLWAVLDGDVLLRSADGRSWERADDGLPDAPIRDVVTSWIEEGVAYALVGSDEIHVTVDAGRSWQPFRSLPWPANDLEQSAASPTHLFAATDRGLMHSVDEGRSWELLAFGNRSVAQVETVTPDRVYAVLDGLVVASSDGGDTWEELRSGRRLSGFFADPAWLVVSTADERMAISQSGGQVFLDVPT